MKVTFVHHYLHDERETLGGSMKVTFVHADDWVAVYGEDGECLQQGHSVQEDKLLEQLGHEVAQFDAQDYADEHGWFPVMLKDMPEEALGPR